MPIDVEVVEANENLCVVDVEDRNELHRLPSNVAGNYLSRWLRPFIGTLSKIINRSKSPTYCVNLCRSFAGVAGFNPEYRFFQIGASTADNRTHSSGGLRASETIR